MSDQDEKYAKAFAEAEAFACRFREKYDLEVCLVLTYETIKIGGKEHSCCGAARSGDAMAAKQLAYEYFQNSAEFST